jgi:AcrR family transcriptional regulator
MAGSAGKSAKLGGVMPSARRSLTRRRLPRAQREAEMIDAALALFTEHGFDGTSMDDIAERAGITKPLLYTYFESKEGLYLACIEHAARPMIEAVAAVAADSEPQIQLWEGLRATLDWIDRNRQVWSTFFLNAVARGGRPAALVAEMQDELTRTLAALFESSATARGIVAVEEVHLQAICLSGATQALARWWLDHPDVPRDLVALRLMNFAWMGLGDLIEGRLWLPPPNPPRPR